jgi:SsrA-binding protein
VYIREPALQNALMAQRKTGLAHRTVCVHRRARHDYDVLQTLEAGLVLKGSEVKALREGKGNLVDAYVSLRGGRPRLHNLEISPFSHDSTGGLETRRTRGLLMHQAEIRKLAVKMREAGLTLVPLEIYFHGPWAKVEIGVCRGRRKADKRQALRTREAQRDMDRAQQRRR